ncbi:hypothetical protein, partial [Gluconacetobacter entanii]
QYEAIHTGFESHLVTLKKYNSQQALEKASPKTFKNLSFGRGGAGYPWPSLFYFVGRDRTSPVCHLPSGARHA